MKISARRPWAHVGLLAALLSLGCQTDSVDSAEIEEAAGKIEALLEVEQQWQVARYVDSVEGYEDFLERHGDGRHGELARTRLQLKKTEAELLEERQDVERLELLLRSPGGTLNVRCECGYIVTFFASWRHDGQPHSWNSGGLSILDPSARTEIPAGAIDVKVWAVTTGGSEFMRLRKPDLTKIYVAYATDFSPRWTAR